MECSNGGLNTLRFIGINWGLVKYCVVKVVVLIKHLYIWSIYDTNRISKLIWRGNCGSKGFIRSIQLHYLVNIAGYLIGIFVYSTVYLCRGVLTIVFVFPKWVIPTWYGWFALHFHGVSNFYLNFILVFFFENFPQKLISNLMRTLQANYPKINFGGPDFFWKFYMYFSVVGEQFWKFFLEFKKKYIFFLDVVFFLVFSSVICVDFPYFIGVLLWVDYFLLIQFFMDWTLFWGW